MKRFLYMLIIWLLVACNASQIQILEDKDEPLISQPKMDPILDENSCIVSKHSFAYQTSGKMAAEIRHSKVLPDKPWVLETALPSFPENSIVSTRKDWVLSAFPRQGEEQEIWILRSWTSDRSKSEYASMQILVYSSKENEWKTVPTNVKGTQAVVGELFMTNDGTIWAHNYREDYFTIFEPPFNIGISQYYQSSPPEYPVLSKYNEGENQFEAVWSTTNILSGKTDGVIKILIDTSDVFWIIVEQDGIYSFTPESEEMVRHADLSQGIYKIPVKSIALDSKENLFFSNNSSAVFRFDRNAGDIEMIGGIPLPFEGKYSLYFYGILLDHMDRLWLGNVGWAEPTEYHNWFQLFPTPIFVTRSEGDTLYYQQKPWLILESVDGRLWYKFTDGLVWMDPQKEKWCWFTTERSNIVQDGKRNLWIVVDGNLYRHPFSPK